MGMLIVDPISVSVAGAILVMVFDHLGIVGGPHPPGHAQRQQARSAKHLRIFPKLLISMACHNYDWRLGFVAHLLNCLQTGNTGKLHIHQNCIRKKNIN